MNDTGNDRDWVEDLTARFAEMQENLRKAQQRAANATATVADPTERVKVAVNQHGKLLKLDICATAMQRMTAAELSSTILTLVSEASTVLQTRITEQFHTAWGTDLSPRDIMDGRIAMSDAIKQLRQANWGPR